VETSPAHVEELACLRFYNGTGGRRLDFKPRPSTSPGPYGEAAAQILPDEPRSICIMKHPVACAYLLRTIRWTEVPSSRPLVHSHW
jgi:hypothetical protein